MGSRGLRSLVGRGGETPRKQTDKSRSPVGLVLDLVLAFAHDLALILPLLALEVFGVLDIRFAGAFESFGTESIGHLLEAQGIFKQELTGVFKLAFVAHGDGALVGFVAKGFVDFDQDIAAQVLLDGAFVKGVAQSGLALGVGALAALHIEEGDIDVRDIFGLFAISDGWFDFEEQIFVLVAVELVKGGEDDVVTDLGGAVEDANRSDTGGAADGDLDLLCDDGGDITEFCAKDAIKIAGITSKPVISVAASCELCHQIFVVSESDADGGDRDTFFGAGFSEATEGIGRARADVGESVRKQDDAIDALFVEELADFGQSFADTTKQGGKSVGLDAVDLADDIFFVRHFGGGNKDVNARIVSDDRKDIVGLKHRNEHPSRLFGAGNAFSAHRTRTIDDNCEIERSALFGGGKEAAFDADFEIDALVSVGAEVWVADGDIKV